MRLAVIAGGGTRTHTPSYGYWILNPARLPIPPLRPAFAVSNLQRVDLCPGRVPFPSRSRERVGLGPQPHAWGRVERTAIQQLSSTDVERIGRTTSKPESHRPTISGILFAPRLHSAAKMQFIQMSFRWIPRSHFCPAPMPIDFGKLPSGLTSANSVEPSLRVEDSRAGEGDERASDPRPRPFHFFHP
jgi:hypothetical protein